MLGENFYPWDVRLRGSGASFLSYGFMIFVCNSLFLCCAFSKSGQSFVWFLNNFLKTLNIHVRFLEAFWQKYQWPRDKPNFLEILAKLFFFYINKQNILNNIVYKFQNTHFPNQMKNAQMRF